MRPRACIRAGADRDAHFHHAPNGWRAFRCAVAVAFDEILALISHSVLDRDATAELCDPVDITIIDRLRMIDDPVQAVERYVAVHFLEHVERPRDRLVVCSVHPPRPAVLRKHANN